MPRLYRSFICLSSCLFFLGSCQVPSKVAMDGSGGRTAYNVSIQSTNAEQMLLNLVRLRYADIPFFLDVASITTQSTFRSELSPVFPAPGFNQENPAKIGTGVMWQDQPTITYTPLEGSAFASRMLRPIDLQTVQVLSYSGWDVDRIFRMLVQNFQGVLTAPEASDPESKYSQYRRFMELSQLLRTFQQKGELQLGIKINEKANVHEESLQIAFPQDGEEGERLADLLECREKDGNRCRKEVEFGFNDEGRLGIMTRSILSCMYYLSRGVEVPEEHVESGMIRLPVCPGDPEEEQWREMFCDLISVHWSKNRPSCAFVAVEYKGYWYYVDEIDRSSKKTFALLMQLYNLNAVVPNNRGPILTLPLR